MPVLVEIAATQIYIFTDKFRHVIRSKINAVKGEKTEVIRVLL